MSQNKLTFINNVKTFFSLYSKKILTVVLIGLLATLMYTIYTSVIQPTIEKTYANNNEFLQKKQTQVGREEKTAKLLLFWADWCPNSNEGKPAWDEFVSKYSGKKINGVIIHTDNYQCDKDGNDKNGNDNSEFIDKYDIDGVPTVVLVKGDNDNDYAKMNAKLNFINLVDFVNVSA